MTELIKVAGWDGGVRLNVVFVHGLGGHAYDTWRRAPENDTFWPVWLSRDIPGLTAWTLAYDANPSNWLGTGMPIQDRATNVLECLLGQHELRSIPLVFVCHSLGGLIVKQMLRVTDGRRAYGDVEACDFIGCVKGVVFIATPHSGSMHATLLDKLRLIAWPSASTLDLVRNNASLRDLNVWYRNWAAPIRHKVFYEEQGTSVGTIVDDASSDPGLLHVEPVGVDADHVMICKPADAKDLVYERTRDFLAEIIKGSSGSIGAYGGNLQFQLPKLMRSGSNKFIPIATRLTFVVLLVLVVFSGLRVLIPSVHPAPSTHVAVLRFQNTNHDNSIDELSALVPYAIDDHLTNASHLTDARALVVVPEMSSLALKNPNARQVKKLLGAGTVIRGAFWLAAGQLSVRVEVIDINQDSVLWSHTFETPLSDQRNLMPRIGSQVTDAIQRHLEIKPIGRSIGTKNGHAYDLYLRGLMWEGEITQGNNDAAIKALEKAVRLDPGFAQAHAALAEAYGTRFWWNLSNDRHWVDLAEAYANKALELDPTLPEAHNALAWALEGKGERQAAAREYFASVRFGPRYVPALQNVARTLFYMGDFDRALATLETIADTDPTVNVHVRKAMCYYFSGNSQDSLRENEEAEKRARGVDELTLVAFTYVWLKELASAERVLERLRQSEPNALSISEIRAWLYTARGQFREAHEQIQILANRGTFGIEDEVAALLALQGDREEAIFWLTKAVRDGAPNYAWYNSDFFKILRGDPRYEKILTQLDDEHRQLRAEISAP